MLKPVHPPWVLDKDGRPKLDAAGKRIPNPKQNQPKTLKEYTDAERRDFERAIEMDEHMKKMQAVQTLAPLAQAQKTLGQR